MVKRMLRELDLGSKRHRMQPAATEEELIAAFKDRQFTCTVCLDEHPYQRTEGEWALMSCCKEIGGHGPVLCKGNCFDGWMRTNPTCPTCRKPWEKELARGKWLKLQIELEQQFKQELEDSRLTREIQLTTMQEQGQSDNAVIAMAARFDREDAAIMERKARALRKLQQDEEAADRRERGESVSVPRPRARSQPRVQGGARAASPIHRPRGRPRAAARARRESEDGEEDEEEAMQIRDRVVRRRRVVDSDQEFEQEEVVYVRTITSSRPFRPVSSSRWTATAVSSSSSASSSRAIPSPLFYATSPPSSPAYEPTSPAYSPTSPAYEPSNPPAWLSEMPPLVLAEYLQPTLSSSSSASGGAALGNLLSDVLAIANANADAAEWRRFFDSDF